MEKSVVFIHGFGGNRYEYQPIASSLRKAGLSKLHHFEYKKKYGNTSLIHLAADLKKFIDEKVRSDERVYLIGLSQGGIIAAYYLAYMNSNHNIKDCIGVCTPFNGSYMAYFLPHTGTRELRPGSRFLSKLEKKIQGSNINVYGVWNPFDLMVFPGKNADADFLKKSKRVYSFMHPTTFRDKSTLEFICDIINEH